MKKKASHSGRKPDISNPNHPFHSFAKKKSAGKSKAQTSSTDRKSATPRNRPAGKRAVNPIGGGTDRSKTQPVAQIDPFPLNKYIAHTGLCARRKAVEYIRAGEITVNGKIIEEPGFKVTEQDTVKFKGKKLFLQLEPVYILLNKPKGYLTTTDDPQERKTVMELIARATDERVYPVGRLDRNTSGLLLFTNDGQMAQALSHPGFSIKKVYQVVLNKALTKHDFEKISQGMELEDGPVTVDALAYNEPDDRSQVGLEIHSGRNRVVRRIFETLGYEVKTLDRVMYAGLTKKNLPRGKWRMLTPKEIVWLKHFSGNKKAGSAAGVAQDASKVKHRKKGKPQRGGGIE